MGKRCIYCGVKLPQNGPVVKIGLNKLCCTKCYEEYYKLLESESTDKIEQGSEEMDEICNNSEPTCDYSVCFYLVDGSMFETTIHNQTEDFHEFINIIFRNPYAVIFEGDKEACCVNLHNVTRFMIRKKEKEE